jgi:hypothetical protein
MLREKSIPITSQNLIIKLQVQNHLIFGDVSQISSLSDDDSQEIEYDVSDLFLPNSQLRFAFEKAVDGITSIVIAKMKVLTIIRLIFIIGFSIGSFIFFFSLFDDTEKFNFNLASFNKAENLLSVLSPQYIWFILEKNSIFFNDSRALNIFGNSITNLPVIMNISLPVKQSIDEYLIKNSQNFDMLSYPLYYSKIIKGTPSYHLAYILFDFPHDQYFCKENNQGCFIHSKYTSIYFLMQNYFSYVYRLCFLNNNQVKNSSIQSSFNPFSEIIS